MTTVWETLCRYFPAIHQAPINAGGINALVNSLSNSFLLDFSLNLVFSRFALAFKATVSLNSHINILLLHYIDTPDQTGPPKHLQNRTIQRVPN